MVVSGEELSDGEGALKETAAREARKRDRVGGSRGPANATLPHWHVPKKTVDPRLGRRWEFRCKHCNQYVVWATTQLTHYSHCFELHVEVVPCAAMLRTVHSRTRNRD